LLIGWVTTVNRNLCSRFAMSPCLSVLPAEDRLSGTSFESWSVIKAWKMKWWERERDTFWDFSSISANEIRGRRAILRAVSLNNAVMKCSVETEKDMPLFPRLLESHIYCNLSLFIIAMCNERQNITINFQLESFQHYRYQESWVIATPDTKPIIRAFVRIDTRSRPWLLSITESSGFEFRLLDRLPWHVFAIVLSSSGYVLGQSLHIGHDRILSYSWFIIAQTHHPPLWLRAS
jgi:hypothetical protein